MPITIMPATDSSRQSVGESLCLLLPAPVKDRHELLMSAGGSDALVWDGAFEARPADWLRTKANSIEGGTSEVMLDILSKRVLELPSS